MNAAEFIRKFAREARACRWRWSLLRLGIGQALVLVLVVLGVELLAPDYTLIAIGLSALLLATVVGIAVARERRHAARLLESDDAPPGSEGRLVDDLTTWVGLDRHRRADGPMADWLATDLAATLATIPAERRRRLGYRPLGRVRYLLPLLVLLFLLRAFQLPLPGLAGDGETVGGQNRADGVGGELVADAGADVDTDTGDEVALNGSASRGDGDALVFRWSPYAADPPQHLRSLVLKGADTAQPIASASVPGEYEVELRVGDGTWWSAPDRVVIQVRDPSPPGVAEAGQQPSVEPSPQPLPQPSDPAGPGEGPDQPAPPNPLLDLPVEDQFVVPHFVGDGETRLALAQRAELEVPGPGGVSPRGGPGVADDQPKLGEPPDFQAAYERAMRARHVPPEERGMVRRYFEALRREAK